MLSYIIFDNDICFCHVIPMYKDGNIYYHVQIFLGKESILCKKPCHRSAVFQTSSKSCEPISSEYN